MDKKIKIWFERSKKPVIILGSIVIIVIVAFLVKATLADPNSGYLKNQTVDGLSFENASLVYESGVSTFKVEVFNETDDTYNLKNISIKLIDEKNDETIMIGYIGDSIEKKEGKYLQASIDKELSSISNIEYMINK